MAPVLLVGLALFIVLTLYVLYGRRLPDEQLESLQASETDTDEESGVRDDHY